MVSPFTNSVFCKLVVANKATNTAPIAILGGMHGSSFDGTELLSSLDFVVFDFETTGLDTKTARIIELGGIRYHNRVAVAEFSTLVNPERALPPETFGITGISDAMLVGKPTIAQALPDFLDLMRGCVGVAHNAEFDTGMLVHESARLGISIHHHILCTYKMAKDLVISDRKNLDSLAKHYLLEFESRHRSIGDIKVTAEVMWRMLDENPKLKALADLNPYREQMTAGK